VTNLGVNIELNNEVTPKLIEDIKPDTVILATGLTPLIPEIPGMNIEKVFLAEEVLTGKAELGERVVVIGAGLVGCETAELLLEKGRAVTILEMLDTPPGRPSRVFRLLLKRLAAKRVRMLTGVKCERLSEEGLTIINREGERHTLQADAIVLAAGGKPNQQLFQTVKNMIHEIYLIGDCVEPRSLPDAIREGFNLASRL
jgi:pyruvate/2-oxoglutarate dehydrogenase complex dihydrolipoamide dehydrogenase (E3) component